MRASFHADEVNYNFLRGDKQGVRSHSGVWDTDYVLEKYVQSTDKVIGLMDGSIHERAVVDPSEPERSSEKPDTVIFLDKSARPVSWFTDALWEQFATDGAEKPDYEFLNIDRVNWFINQGHSKIDAERRLGPGDFDINKVPKEDLARIRALFVQGELDRDTWQDDVWDMPTSLDDKNVLILDEVKNKGGTLAIATQVLKGAFPEATFSGDYFWRGGQYALGGNANEMQMESAPVWYDSKDAWGRGVGDISRAYYEHVDGREHTDESFKHKLGWIALSAPHFNPVTYETITDTKAQKLEQDIAFLSYDVADGRILRSPDRDRPINQHEDILRGQGTTIRKRGQYASRREDENDARHRAA